MSSITIPVTELSPLGYYIIRHKRNMLQRVGMLLYTLQQDGINFARFSDLGHLINKLDIVTYGDNEWSFHYHLTFTENDENNRI